MASHFQRKSANLDLILQTISTAKPLDPDGSFEGKPVLLWLESTARCNLRCAKCGHAFDPPGTPRTLPRNLANAVVDEADEYFAAAVKVRTSGYGEMFLFSRLRSFVERIKRYECWTEGTTNGVVIDRSEIDWLIELGYDQLVFSIDGADPETMQRLRGADLNRIWETLRYICDKKAEVGAAKPQIVVGFVAQSDNIAELPALVRKLADLNISFLAVNTLFYRKYDPDAEDSYGRLYHDYNLANLDRRHVEALIEEARRLAEEARIGFGLYIDLDRVYREAAGEGEEDMLVTIGTQPETGPHEIALLPKEPLKPFYCVYPWTSLFVTARGSTTVCCSMRGDIGTVLNSGDIDRAWNGQVLRDIRRAIARGEVHPNCAYCVSRNRHLSSFVDLESVKAALAEQAEPEIPVAAATAPIPTEPLFGYIDTRTLEARSLQRLRIAGWSASGRFGAPVREVKLRLDGQELSTIHTFHARPDVAAHYGRKDLLHSGWQVTVKIPQLAPGDYELVAEVSDPEGTSATLGPAVVRITG